MKAVYGRLKEIRSPGNIPALIKLLAGAVIFMLLFQWLGGMRIECGPFQLDLSLAWGWPGMSRLVLPPLGEAQADTHHLPLIISVRLDRIDLPLLQNELIGITNPHAYLTSLIPRLRLAGCLWFIKSLLMGGILGFVIAWFLGKKDYRSLLRASGVGLIGILLLLIFLILDFDQTALQNPRYEGALEAAPLTLNLIDKGLAYLPELNAKLTTVAGNLNQMVDRVGRLETLGDVEGELKLLHISDIHNHPAAFDFVKRVVDGFGVDLVIDTGDLTDYGTELETEISSKIKSLGVKYLFIPGNHDSPEVVKKMRQYKNVTVLQRGLFKFKGLKIWGWEDPAASGKRITVEPEVFEKAAADFKRNFEKLEATPDIVAVHNRELAGDIVNKTPLLLSGHTHRPLIKIEEGAVYINAGTTGAAGLRGLENPSLHYSLALLHFNQTENNDAPKLTAVDLIRIDSFNGKLVLERRVIPRDDPERS